MKNRMKTANARGTATGSDFLSLGLYSFAGLGVEAFYAYLLEPILYNAPMQDWSTVQIISHWILTCITWGFIAFILIKKSREKHNFFIMEKGSRMKLWQWSVCVLFILLAFLMSYMSWNGFKLYIEFTKKGPLLFTFQYIYYAFETMLFLLIIVFSQKACELWLHKMNFPYGGIICGLTWGLAHIFTKDLLTGIMGLLLGIAMGSVYLLVNRDIKRAYLVLLLMFII